MSKRIPKVGTLVQVVYDDLSSTDTDWKPPEEFKHATPSEVIAVGFVVHKDRKIVRLAMMQVIDNPGEPAQYGTLAIIPRGGIKSVKELK